MSEAARELVATACRVLEANGHADYVWGHVSLRDEENRGFWMKPAGFGFDEVGPEDVILVDFDGTVIEGDRKRHSEWPIHAELMLKDPSINSVVHTHPPHAIALAARGEELLPVSHAGTLFTPPSVPRFDLTANLILTPELGRALAATVGEARVAFMVNHGIVAAGGSVQEAVARAVLLEKACDQQLKITSPGVTPSFPSAEESLEKRGTVWPPSHIDALWEYLVRRLQR
ncbi:class II aldolase/adducin family protein [Leucobacter sp. USHLN153]|uniref:class II aldolase/adducin family protein n=1 Tax=Leucobacter sp. USHLN153 TaxID=3081268 RepID=UPI0030196A8C